MADYERQIKELKECKARLRNEHAAALAALRAELEAAMAKALADLEARLKAAHAAEIEKLLADAAAKLAAALAALRADLEAQIAALKAQAERDAAELAKLRKEVADAGATTFYYEKVQKELDAAMQLPIGKTVARIQEIIEELAMFQARHTRCFLFCFRADRSFFASAEGGDGQEGRSLSVSGTPWPAMSRPRTHPQPHRALRRRDDGRAAHLPHVNCDLYRDHFAPRTRSEHRAGRRARPTAAGARGVQPRSPYLE